MNILKIAFYFVEYANVWCLLAIVDTVFVMLTTRNNYTVKPNVKTAVNKTGLLIIFSATADMMAYYAYGVPEAKWWIQIGYFIVFQVPILAPIIYCEALDATFFQSHTGKMLRFLAFLYGLSMLLNLFYPIYFYISDAGEYEQCQFWFIRPFVVVIVYFIIFSEVMMKKYVISNNEIKTFNYVMVLFFIGIIYTDIFYAGQIIELVLSSGFSFMTGMLQNLEFKTDPVTKLSNRVVYTEEAFKNKDAKDLVVASMDVNDLKKYNDTEGHAAGDAYLRAVTLTYNKYLKKYGQIYRIGGDEFVFMGKNQEAVTDIFMRLHGQEKVDMEFGVQDLSVAYGIVVKQPDESVFDAVNRADELMYECKKSMKNSEKNFH